MSSHQLKITARDGGTFGAYISVPPAKKGPGIIIIQEVFGINSFLREMADFYASLGYIAVVPDLFWRLEPGLDLDDRKEADLQKAFSLFPRFDLNKGVDDLESTLQALRAMPECTGSVGAVGFCLGGKLAYLMATRTNCDCSVSYYGVHIEQLLDEASNIKAPLMLHFAELDSFVPPEALKKITERLSVNPNITIYSYPNVDHAFARTHGKNYNKEAAELAQKRSVDFFKKHLLKA